MAMMLGLALLGMRGGLAFACLFFFADFLDFFGAEFAFFEFFFGRFAGAFFEFSFFFSFFFGFEFFFEGERGRARKEWRCVRGAGQEQAGEGEEDYEEGEFEEGELGRHARIHRLAVAPPLAKSVYSRALHPQQGLLHR